MANSGVSKARVCGLMICQNGNKETLGGYSKMVAFEWAQKAWKKAGLTLGLSEYMEDLVGGVINSM